MYYCIDCCEEKDELAYFHLAFLLILENSQAYIYKTHTGYTITNCLHVYSYIAYINTYCDAVRYSYNIVFSSDC
jgi:hypothetical protein